MAKQIINIGQTPNDKTGDPLRTAFEKVNSNFNELYARAENTDSQTLSLVDDILSISGGNSVDLSQYATVVPSTGDFIISSRTIASSTIGDVTIQSLGPGGSPSDPPYQYNWNFTSGGRLQLPPTGDIVDSSGISLLYNISYTRLTDIPTIPTDVSDLTDSTGLLGGGTGDITFAATTISAPNQDEIVIQSKDSNSFGTARVTLNSEFGGDARLRAFSSESVDTFTLANGDFATGVWRDNGFGNGVVEFTGAQGIGDFFQNTLFKLTPDNVSITINGGTPFVWNGGANGAGTDTPGFGTNPIVPATPITITSIEFRYRSESFISVNYDNQEIRLNVQNGGIVFDANNTIQMFGDSNIELQSGSDFSINSGQNISIGTGSADSISLSTGDLNFTAFDDVNFRGSDSFRIRNTSSTAPIRIITDDNNTQKTWAFNPDGSLTFPDATIQTTAYTGTSTGDITFSGVKIQGAGTASGDGNGYATIELVPDTNLYINDQYLIIDPTAPSHIHIRAGGTQDASNTELYLGGENSYFRVSAGSTPSVEIKATDNSVLVRTQSTVVTDNIYTNTTDFVTDIDIGGGIVISGWSQRNESEIELNLFVDPVGIVYTYLTSLGIGSDVVVTYSTAGGNQTFTSTISQVFAPVAQFDPVTGWQRIAGRILGILPADQTGIMSVNFPVTTSSQYGWTFDPDGNLTVPGELHGAPVISVGPTPSQVGRTVNITPADDASDKKFRFRIDQYAGQLFTRAYLELPTAEVDKQVAAVFPHTNNTAGYIYTQGADTFDDGLNNAFNIFYNAGDIKLTAMTPVTGTFNIWKFGSNGDLTVPGKITGGDSSNNLDITASNYVTIESTGGGQIMLGANQLVGSNNGSVVIGHSGNVTDLSSGKLRINATVPTTSVGAVGDVDGLVAFDNNYIYYCTAFYDGVTNIWKRVAWSGDTW